jgi:hypothetical protein
MSRRLQRRALLRDAAAAAGAVILAAAGRTRAVSAGATGVLSGRVVLPGDPSYDASRTDFNQRFNIFPKAIVYCHSNADVANAIA